MRHRPANLHARYSAWQGDEAGEAEARRLSFDVTHVVWDGSGNCPCQKSLARFLARKHEIARALRAQGLGSSPPLEVMPHAAEKELDLVFAILEERGSARHPIEKQV